MIYLEKTEQNLMERENMTCLSFTKFAVVLFLDVVLLL